MKKTLYIGLNNNFHDPSICIIDNNGDILFAECAERFLQYKRAIGCPPAPDFYIESIINKYIPFEVDELVIAFSWTEWSIIKAKIYSVFHHFKGVNNTQLPNLELATSRYLAAINQTGAGIIRAFKLKNKNIKITKKYHNHHLCHIYNSLYSSKNRDGIGLVIDGKGDDTSYTIYNIKDGQVLSTRKIKGIQSLGELYGFYTELCGYSHLKGEEWKVMGLSPYGNENKLLQHLIDEELEKLIFFKSNTGDIVNNIQNKIYQQKTPQADIAFLAQHLFETLFFNVIDQIKHKYPTTKTLFLSGGSALNTLAIGKLYEKNSFDTIIVPNAPADDGNAVGSAILAYMEFNNQKLPPLKQQARSPFLGSEISNDVVEKYIHTSNLPFIKVENPAKYAAKLLNENKIIGWIQGRAEFGPRALGNRSILAHPGFLENKDRINAVVKFRESYRPFAPSILDEFGNEYFEKYSFTPYMEKTLTFKDSVKAKVPAVVHINGTGRLQSVTKDLNEKFYSLITEFHVLTGIPLVVNTSYNVMGKPIVNDINDVMAVYFNSSIDAVIIGNYVLERNNNKL